MLGDGARRNGGDGDCELGHNDRVDRDYDADNGHRGRVYRALFWNELKQRAL